jgi:hypothetical protein
MRLQSQIAAAGTKEGGELDTALGTELASLDRLSGGRLLPAFGLGAVAMGHPSAAGPAGPPDCRIRAHL